MSRVKFAALSFAVALTAVAVAASSAAAAISFEWRVNGKSLGAGESRAFEAASGLTPWDLHSSIAGTSILILFDRVLYDGRHIFRPRGSVLLFLLELPLVHRPTKCAITGEKVETTPLEGEIVEGASGGVGNGEVEILFNPTAGTTFATFEFSGSSCIVKGAVASIAGSILSLVSPQKTEVLKNDLTLEANAKEYHNQAGAFKTAGLTLAGEPATLSGLFLMSLTSDEVFGAF